MVAKPAGDISSSVVTEIPVPRSSDVSVIPRSSDRVNPFPTEGEHLLDHITERIEVAPEMGSEDYEEIFISHSTAIQHEQHRVAPVSSSATKTTR